MTKKQLINNYQEFLINLSFLEKQNYERKVKSAKQCCDEFVCLSIRSLANSGYPVASPAFVKRQQKAFEYVKDYRNVRTFNEGLLNIYKEMLKIATEF